MHKIMACMLANVLPLVVGSAHATQTISYAYDAKGRLVKVVHSGTVNSGVTVDYTHDTADNRTNVKTTGSTN